MEGHETLLQSWLRHQQAEWLSLGLYLLRGERKMGAWWVDGQEEGSENL